MENKERWQPVVGFEGLYEVSNFGRVRGVDRILTYERTDQYSGKRLCINRKKTWNRSPSSSRTQRAFVRSPR